MSRTLLLFSHDFHVNLKKTFKAHDVYFMDINAEVLNQSKHKSHKLISNLVECLFVGYDKLTLITNYTPRIDIKSTFGDRYLGLTIKSNDIKDSYELSDFHAAVMSHFTSHRLLVESLVFLKKALVSATLSKTTSNLKTLNRLIDDYDVLIHKSKSALAVYAEDIILRFGA